MDHTKFSQSLRDRHGRAPSRVSTSTTSPHGQLYGPITPLAPSPRTPHPSSLPSRPSTTTGTRPRPSERRTDIQSPTSNFLLERLQRERRADPDSRSPTSPDQGTSDPSQSLTSPIREGFARPSTSSADARRKGMGVKEMEHTVSTLHKQNFDLKLELYHRRERQTALEERLEALRAEKAQADDMNDTLVAELEKRDKAVGEAVAMIVMLESRVETLLEEREMVRRVEAQTTFGGLRDDFESARTETPKPRDTDASAKTVHRAPSFLSVRSDTTENLRSVYVGTHGSLHSVRKGDGEDTKEDTKDRGSVASPALSVLSESSFMSVYGRDKGPAEGRPSMDESISEMRMPGRGLFSTPQSRVTSGVLPPASRTSSISRSQPPGMVDHTSPLQRLERTFSQTGSSKSPSAEESSPQSRTKQQKREALRRVMTDTNRVRDGGMPPTPDTISTTTLRRYREEAQASSPHGPPDPEPEPKPEPATQAPAPEVPREAGLLPPMSRFSSRASYFDDESPIMRRPKSADELTKHDWDGDDDSDGRSSVDIWMREGVANAKGKGKERAESPDLFGFPSSAAGTWGEGKSGAGELAAADFLPGPPPPPKRRSSLHAPTGSAAEVEVEMWRRSNSRRGSGSFGTQSLRTEKGSEKGSEGKGKDHYPPATQQGRRGLGRLNPFRRSVIEAQAQEKGSPSASPMSNSPMSNSPMSNMGVPSWIRAEEDRSGATPPPIQRSRGMSVGKEIDGGVSLLMDNAGGGVSVSPAGRSRAGSVTGVMSGIVNRGRSGSVSGASRRGSLAGSTSGSTVMVGGGGAGSANGAAEGKRKWLGGFGRRDSLRRG